MQTAQYLLVTYSLIMFIVNIGLLEAYMYEWYNLTVKYMGDWGTLGLREH